VGDIIRRDMSRYVMYRHKRLIGGKGKSLCIAHSDKKRAGGDITLVIPRKIGACQLRKVPVGDLLPIIRAGLEA